MSRDFLSPVITDWWSNIAWICEFRCCGIIFLVSLMNRLNRCRSPIVSLCFLSSPPSYPHSLLHSYRLWYASWYVQWGYATSTPWWTSWFSIPAAPSSHAPLSTRHAPPRPAWHASPSYPSYGHATPSSTNTGWVWYTTNRTITHVLLIITHLIIYSLTQSNSKSSSHPFNLYLSHSSIHVFFIHLSICLFTNVE